MEIKNINQTKFLARALGQKIKQKGAFISLYGEIGAGKTAFVRFLLQYLGVNQNITSPSFVILNEYKSKFFPIYHFDLYRLEQSGINSIKQELFEYSKENILTVVEWANFGAGELPVEKLDIKISYGEKDIRYFEFTGSNDYYNLIIDKITKEFYEHFNN